MLLPWAQSEQLVGSTNIFDINEKGVSTALTIVSVNDIVAPVVFMWRGDGLEDIRPGAVNEPAPVRQRSHHQGAAIRRLKRKPRRGMACGGIWKLERVTGIEPVSSAWKAEALTVVLHAPATRNLRLPAQGIKSGIYS